MTVGSGEALQQMAMDSSDGLGVTIRVTESPMNCIKAT